MENKDDSMPRNLKRKQPSTSETTDLPSINNDEIEQIEKRIHNLLSRLPSGFMFKPTDTELICNYLRPKIAKQKLTICLIHDLNVYASHPKTLSENYLKHPQTDELYCFSPRDRKYKNGSRPKRSVDGIGFWKATGADVKIKIGNEVIGSVRMLTFYEGPHKTGIKTNWIMHEYRTCESRERISKDDMKLDDWVLCKIRENKTARSKSEANNENNDEAPTTTTNISVSDTEKAAVNDDNIIPDCEATSDISDSDSGTSAVNEDNIIPDCEVPTDICDSDTGTSAVNEDKMEDGDEEIDRK